MKGSFFFLIFCFSCSLCWCQSSNGTNIQDIRLVGGNEYSGNVQLLYNGVWGTVCDSSWGTQDANVACRMLGFDGASCATYNARYGITSSSVPIWISSVSCRGYEEYLDQCYYRGWSNGRHSCYSHSDDAGVVCYDETLFEEPDVSVVNTTTKSIAITFPKVNSSVSIVRQRYRIQFNTTEYNVRSTYIYPSIYSAGPYFAVISNLIRETTYSISVRLEVVPSECSYYSSYNAVSEFSTPISVTTSSEVRPSNFNVRLIPAVSGLNFTGRVEVNYNNSGWGTICDYFFDISDAHVICGMLGYDNAVCAVSNAQLGRGSGPIWLNRLSCSSGAEILDDCSYRNYSDGHYLSQTACRSTHYDDAGVICRPEPEEFLPAPEDFNATLDVLSSRTIRFSWKPYIFPSYLYSSYWYYYSTTRRFRIDYTRSDRSSRYQYSLYPSHSSSSYTLTSIPFGVTITATITTQGAFRQYSCYSLIDGATSNTASVTVVERPPSTAPLNFYVSVVNCTAIMAEWDLPSYNTRNGIIRGFKLFYKKHQDDRETIIDLSANVTEYILQGLEPSTSYVISVLAYTVGDGPRSIHLTVTTNSLQICQTDIINFFGVNGNDLDRITVYSYYYRAVRVFCGSGLSNVQINWLYSNGTKVGSSNRHIREGHYQNGTAELTIGHVGRITACDGGIYICRANRTSNNHAQQRTFKLTYNSSPPTPARPGVLKVTSNSIVLKWPEYECDGGHDVHYFNIRIGHYTSSYSYSIRYRYINGVEARFSNYTITGLTSSTAYFISIAAVGTNNRGSSYSPSSTVVTLPPAPTPPGSVSVKLIPPNSIMVNWTKPSVVNAQIAYYTVYATPFISRTSLTPRTKRQTDSLQVVSKNFSSIATSGIIILPRLGLEYHVQVSVTVLDPATRVNRESLFSALGPNSIIFVPIQGLPFPTNVKIIGSSNSTLTISWTIPDSTGDTITGYLIEYSGTIDGRSPAGTVLRFTHAGNTTISSDATSFTIQPLVPQTSYLIKVAALTNRGEGMQIIVTGSTTNADSVFERYVYFQLRFGPVLDCSAFMANIRGQESIVKQQVFGHLRRTCNCGFTEANIIRGFFFCAQQNDEILYRAHILGTSNYSAIALVEMLQNWIQDGRAYVTVNYFRMQLDSSCTTRLDTLNDPECYAVKPNTQINRPTELPKETEKEDNGNSAKNQQQNMASPNQSSGISAGALGGIFVGLIIALLLVILIVFIIFIVFWKLQKFKNQKNDSSGSEVITNQGNTVRLAHLKNGGNQYEEEQFPNQPLPDKPN